MVTTMVSIAVNIVFGITLLVSMMSHPKKDVKQNEAQNVSVVTTQQNEK